jgi:aryl-alcohol dehydrogenase-like predicted oxidoreductase
LGDYSKTNRRTFLRRAGFITAGVAGLGGCLKYKSQFFLLRDAPEHEGDPELDWSAAEIREYKPLGRTGWKMSDISFGAGGLKDPAVLETALERGVNYIDTSPDYSHSESELAVGKAIKNRRDKVFVASKFCSPEGHLDEDTSVDGIIEAVEASLGRLDTDYVDLLHIHACNSVDRLMAPTFHEAFDRLKEQGKARFMGVSSHTPELETVMRTAVDSGRFDVIMCAYNFSAWPDLESIFSDAHDRGIGVVAMKTLKGAYHTVLRDLEADERNSFSQAAFKWVNNNPDVSGLVITVTKPEQLDEYLVASGKRADPADLALLEKYDRLVRSEYCRPGCGDCLDACPAALPIDDVLRYSMYFASYGAEKEALTRYAAMRKKLGHGTEVCASCSAPCQARCPYEIPIKEKLVRADRDLRLHSV